MESVKVGGFTLLYEVNNGEASIMGIEGSDSHLSIPNKVSVTEREVPVTSISKKAIMGVNGLRHIMIPETVREIGDWAFAHCIHLVSLTILNKEVSFGRGMLEGCIRLNSVSIGYEGEDDLSILLASALNKMPAGYLISSGEMGSESWFRNYDSSLVQYLRESDYAGSDEAALCGEEDISYDDIRSVDGELLGVDASYILGVRKNKNFLCMMRLMHKQFLLPDMEEFLLSYVKSHTIKNANNAAWIAIKDDLYADDAYLKLYLDITKPDSIEIDMMLNDLGNNHPEMKAMLLKYGGGDNRVDDFFDGMLL